MMPFGSPSFIRSFALWPSSSWRRKAVAHLEMMRPYTMFHAGLMAVAGAEVISAGQAPPWRVALAGLVTICGWEAGLYAGDYYDRELDARSKPGRPVPSGRVPASEAFWTMVALIAAGYVAALVLGVANLALAVATTVLGIAYSKVFKAKALLGNFDRGVLAICAVGFGALAGYGPTTSGRELLAAATLAALAFFHDSATNLVGAVRDVEGDRAAGYRTVPVVYGVARAVEIVVLLAVVGIGLGAVLMLALRPPLLALGLFGAALALDAMIYGLLLATRGRITRPQALRAHKVLVAERLVLMSAVIAAYAPAAALWLLAATLAATLGSQALLRDRYEQQVIRPAVPLVGKPASERG
jgi:geranylgeranylglycerol-phosphate geranylgeranyltransferase